MNLTKLDILFSEFIRKRAIQRVQGCERCLVGKITYKELQCSHLIGRARRAVRWDTDNAAGLCAGCHMYLAAHPLEHVKWFIDYLGAQEVDLLMARNRIKDKPDENLISIYLKERIKEVNNA